MKVKSESEVAQSCLTLATPWTAAYQAPPSMGFSRQEYWSGGRMLHLTFNLTLENKQFQTEEVFRVGVYETKTHSLLSGKKTENRRFLQHSIMHVSCV